MSHKSDAHGEEKQKILLPSLLSNGKVLKSVRSEDIFRTTTHMGEKKGLKLAFGRME